jgi:hypothetical protein
MAIQVGLKPSAQELLEALRCFKQDNPDIFRSYFTVNHLSHELKVGRREKKKSWAVTGIWYGRMGFVSDPETYLIPDLMLSDPAKYREERILDLKDKKIKNIEAQIADHNKEIAILSEELEDTKLGIHDKYKSGRF